MRALFKLFAIRDYRVIRIHGSQNVKQSFFCIAQDIQLFSPPADDDVNSFLTLVPAVFNESTSALPFSINTPPDKRILPNI